MCKVFKYLLFSREVYQAVESGVGGRAHLYSLNSDFPDSLQGCTWEYLMYRTLG